MNLLLLILAANAIIVVGASGIAAILLSQNIDKLTLTGNIKAGLPPVRFPDFSIKDGNTTITTGDLFSVSLIYCKSVSIQ